MMRSAFSRSGAKLLLCSVVALGLCGVVTLNASSPSTSDLVRAFHDLSTCITCTPKQFETVRATSERLLTASEKKTTLGDAILISGAPTLAMLIGSLAVLCARIPENFQAFSHTVHLTVHLTSHLSYTCTHTHTTLH